MITLKTLPEATAQQVFDQVARHLLTQMKRSLNEMMECLYRGPDGLKCAAGCLIADDEYQPGWEDVTWYGLVERGLAPKQHDTLISDLQHLHDNNDQYFWKEALCNLATRHNLSPAVLDEFAS
jgi:hypothetical protein